MTHSTPPSKPRAIAHAGAVAGLVAIAAFCIGLVLFIFDLRSVAQDADQSNRELRATLIARCEARVEYDKRFIEAAKGDARLFDELLAAGELVDLKTLPATEATRQQAQVEAIADARERKLAIIAEGVIENCQELAYAAAANR